MAEKNKIFSIIMPVFNGEKYVADAIQSIINQTYTNWELLICDDYSTDNSYEIIKRFQSEQIKVFRNKSNRSKIETCNQLIPDCQGDYITIHDADDYSHPNRFSEVLKAFENDSDLGMVGSNATIVKRKKKIIRNTNYNLTYEVIFEEIEKQNQFMGASVFIKSEILKNIGGYHPFFKNFSCEDYELTFRVVNEHKAINLKDNLYFYRQHGQGLSKSIDLNRHISDQLVKKLIKIKRGKNKNLLIDDVNQVNLFVDQLKQKYGQDPSLLFHEYCSVFVYNKLYLKALMTSLLAITNKPFNLKNYRLLFYIVRKSLFNR